MLELRPVVIRASGKKTVLSAEVAVERLHRHLPRIEGGLFASTAWVDGELVGVAVASLPKARLAWIEHAWTGARGYASEDNENRAKERIWFSPHCLPLEAQRGLFEATGGA